MVLLALHIHRRRAGNRDIWNEDLRVYEAVDGGCELHTAMESLCMGWSWALYFCNEAVCNVARVATKDPQLPLLQDRTPGPVVEAALVYMPVGQ